MTAAQPDCFERAAASYVRGMLRAHETADNDLFRMPLDTLTACDLERLIALGLAAGLRLHRFKRTMGLPRVQRVLGALKSLAPADLLDIGSGRGAFLWPLLDAFPALPVTAVDRDTQRLDVLTAVQDGGLPYFTAQHGDATALPFAAGQFDVVTVLEVLEHIPEAQQALSEVVRVARRAVTLSVPSRPDNNPEHIHLFSQGDLLAMFARAGAGRVRFDYVHNHLIAVASVGLHGTA